MQDVSQVIGNRSRQKPVIANGKTDEAKYRAEKLVEMAKRVTLSLMRQNGPVKAKRFIQLRTCAEICKYMFTDRNLTEFTLVNEEEWTQIPFSRCTKIKISQKTCGWNLCKKK